MTRETKLVDGTRITCLLPTEATVLDHHVAGYFQHGIELGEDAIVFDVGANIGVFGVRITQRFAQSRVFAFEPIPDIYACLKANAERISTQRFITYQAGISDREGELVFTYYPNSPALSTAKPEQWNEQELRDAVDGSIAHPPPHLWFSKLLPRPIRRLIARWFAGKMRRGAREVQAPLLTVSQTIDEHQLTCIDLLKIDCEGAELECLLGIRSEHWPLIRQVVVEVHDQEGLLNMIQERLTLMGLDLQVTEKEEALANTTLVNVFARRSDKT